jgi:hypothetical protein
MQEHIRIGMTYGSPVMLDPDAAQPERFAIQEAVYIVSEADPVIHGSGL